MIQQPNWNGDANAHFNLVVKVKAQYAVVKFDQAYGEKGQFVNVNKNVIDHLNTHNANNFERLCTEISTVQ